MFYVSRWSNIFRYYLITQEVNNQSKFTRATKNIAVESALHISGIFFGESLISKEKFWSTESSIMERHKRDTIKYCLTVLQNR